MMEVVGPDGIDAIPAPRGWGNGTHVVAGLFGDEHDVPVHGRPYPLLQLAENMGIALVLDGIGGIEPQPIEVVTPHPLNSVVDDEIPHETGIRTVVVDRFSP